MRAALVTTRPPPPPTLAPGSAGDSPASGRATSTGFAMRESAGGTPALPGVGSRLSHPHRHQHIERALDLLIGEQCRRTRVGQPEHRRIAFELGCDIEQIARVEPDIEGIGPVANL